MTIDQDIEHAARRVVLYYHQGNGNMDDRLGSLNRAVKLARIKATFVQSPGIAGWIGSEAVIARDFREQIDKACRYGRVEREIADVAIVITEYRNIPLWKRVLRTIGINTR